MASTSSSSVNFVDKMREMAIAARKSEQFKDPSLNHYLTRNYRSGFAVPKLV